MPALAVRLSGDLRLGFAPGFLLSTGHLSFDETTCGLGGHPDCAAAEDPAADARYDISSSSGFSSAKFAFTLGGGLYLPEARLGDGAGLLEPSIWRKRRRARGDRGQRHARSPLPPRDGGGPVTCMNGRADGRGCVFADVSYKLPYTVTGGVTWHPRPGAELALILRYLSFGSNDVIDIRIARAPAPGEGLPEHIVLHRGYDSMLDTRVRFAQWLGERLRIGAGLRVETSALPASDVSPAAVDGLKVQPTAMVMYRPAQAPVARGRLRVHVHVRRDGGAGILRSRRPPVCASRHRAT